MRSFSVRPAAGVALVSLTCLALGSSLVESGEERRPLRSVVGSAEKLLAHFERWKEDSPRARAGELTLHLAWSKGRSSMFTTARGLVRIDMQSGRADVEVERAYEFDAVDVWLVPYADGNGAPPTRPLGRVELRDGSGHMALTLAEAIRDMELDLVVVTPAGAGPESGSLMVGTPTLFERMLAAERAGETRVRGVGLSSGSVTAAAVVPGIPGQEFEGLVTLGERLFFGETFGGNTRTCGTCHPAENNFTIDPAFIATLPITDPLFLAETNPALDSTQNGGLVFEDPVLMRRFGLIVANLDGFDDLDRRYVMRGVPHVLGLANSIRPAGNLDQPLTHLTGWGGDGAPGSGSLREFAVGAVRQHFPRTMGRVAGVDFRLPTPHELNALEAFQLSLGRPEDPDLDTMTFLDPGAQLGKGVFALPGQCGLCHLDGGASGVFAGGIGVGGFMADTGVEAFTRNHPDGTGRPRPIDGGFGTNPEGEIGDLVPGSDGSYGDGTFNTPSVIEMADTLPAFHSNLTAIPGAGLANTVEGAIEFYTTPEAEAALGFAISLSTDEIAATGRFLRVLNALENLRSAEELRARAEADLSSSAPDLVRVTRIAWLAAHECRDVVEVLAAVDLHPLAQADVVLARAHFAAAASGSIASRLAELLAAAPLIASARSAMVQ